MADLDIRLDLLDQLVDDLAAIASEFEGADDFSDDVAAAVGHDELHGKVRDFAHKWNDKRKEMTAAVTALQGQIKSISEAFTKVDSELAKALEAGANDVARTNPGAVPQ